MPAIAHPADHRAASPASREERFRWLDQLPAEWREMVVTPLHFASHREYEMAASRTFGYDADGTPCFYHHSYLLAEPRSDNDEDFYAVVTHGETLRAWRLRDDRWLTWQRAVCDDDGTTSRGFYAFTPTCPR